MVGRVVDGPQYIVTPFHGTDDAVDAVDHDVLRGPHGIHEGFVIIHAGIPRRVVVLDHLRNREGGVGRRDDVRLVGILDIRQLLQHPADRVVAVVIRVDAQDQRCFQPPVDAVHPAFRAVHLRQDLPVILPPDQPAGRVGDIRVRVGAVVFLVFRRVVVEFTAADIKDDPAAVIRRQVQITAPGDMDFLRHQGQQGCGEDIIGVEQAVMSIQIQKRAHEIPPFLQQLYHTRPRRPKSAIICWI